MRYIISLLMASAALPAFAAPPAVVTDIPPVHALVAEVMGDLGAPTLLLDRGANAHSFQLRPSQATHLADAGLVVWVGPGMTPWLERALDGLGSNAAQLTLLDVAGTHLQDFADTSGADTAHDDHAHDDDHADHAAPAEPADHDEHDHSGLDPHAWLDPENARVWVAAIAAELARLDPENAAIYAANAEATRARLAALDSEIAARLAPVKARPFVTAHAAYGYFAAHYGLTTAGALALGDATAPGAAHLAELRAKITEAQVQCIFPETGHDAKPIRQLIEGTAVRLGGTLDPAGADLEPGPDGYGRLLRSMADTLHGCLSAQ